MSNSSEHDITISYYVEEIEKHEEDNLNIEELMAKIENTEIEDDEIDCNDDLMIPQMINYNENYTVKELLLICEYYGFAKDLKTNKFNKEQIINFLVSFETDQNNSDIVCKRQNMWFYINELKSDKFMKKFVIW
jgi:hypothetical protein